MLEQGIKGEQLARELLKKRGYTIFEIDWIAEKNDNYLQVEVKHKEGFKPPPFYGHGMEVWKVKKRLDFEARFGIRAYFLIFDTDSSIYGQFLNKLNKTKYFDTKNGIRIYNIIEFEKLGATQCPANV